MFGFGKPKTLKFFMVYTEAKKDWDLLKELCARITPEILDKYFGLAGTVSKDQDNTTAIFPLRGGGTLRVGFVNTKTELSKRLNIYDGYAFSLKDVPKKSPITNETVDAAYEAVVEFLTGEATKRGPDYPAIRCAIL